MQVGELSEPGSLGCSPAPSFTPAHPPLPNSALSMAWMSVWMGAKGNGVEWGWLKESSGASFMSTL